MSELDVATDEMTYGRRLDALHALKLEQTREKREVLGPRDADEQGHVLPPPEVREVVEAISGSGEAVRDVIISTFKPESNHPSGGFFGAKATGANFKSLLEVHPTYVNPLNSMAGVYMVNFNSYRKPDWNPDLDYSHLHEEQERYRLIHGIGGLQHFCPDLKIGLDLGWGGLLDKVRRYREVNTDAVDFYDGLESIVTGIQGWISRHAEDAARMARDEINPQLRENLEAMADSCGRLASAAPATFRDACQWLVFFQAAAKMHNGSGEWGQLDELLRPYYERDSAAGTLTDEEAVFHIACLLLSETAYIQIGGPDADGSDLSSPVSFLILEAIHRLRIPANIAIRVGEGLDPKLFRRGVEILFEDRMGFPKFLGDESVNAGFMRNGYPIELARERKYSGCHWLAVPGREYTLNDIVKIDLAVVFEVALNEMAADAGANTGVEELWRRFQGHLQRAVEATALGIDFHMEHMHEVFPELLLDLFCHGPLEKGLDATQGGVEFYNMCVDGASLATVADSFAALEQRVEAESRLTWSEILGHLEADWGGAGGERARLMMRNIARFGSGGSRADEWAMRVAGSFTRLVKEKPTPAGFNMIPGFFSWAKVVDFGKAMGATPNGRHAGAAVSHGPNPDPGFNRGQGGTPTQLAAAVAAVQPGYGNPAPLQLDLDPGVAHGEEGLEKIEALMQGHFDLGGTLINVNVLNREQVLEAHRDPASFPDLIVRVTGFSAYFANLSEELRQYVVDRIVAEA